MNRVREFEQLLKSRSILHKAKLVIRNLRGDVIIDFLENYALKDFGYTAEQ